MNNTFLHFGYAPRPRQQRIFARFPPKKCIDGYPRKPGFSDFRVMEIRHIQKCQPFAENAPRTRLESAAERARSSLSIAYP